MYPCASFGSITSRAVPPSPLIAAKSRSELIGKVPELLSASPCVIKIGSLIESAYTKGDIRRYTSRACQNVRSSFWKPNGVSVRL